MPETDPSITPRCSRCDSDALIPGAFFYYPEMGGAMSLKVGVHTKPKAVMMKGTVLSDLRVRVCGDCGFVEAEVADPHKLWDAYVDRLAREMDD